MKSRNKIISRLYKQEVNTLYSYGCKFTRNKELVKDCIHDVFVKLAEKKDILTIQNMKLYLLQAFKNRLLNELSRMQPASIDEVTFTYVPDEDVSQLMDMDETSRLRKQYIEQIFELLSERQKEAVYLYYIEELTYDEIGQLMEMNYQSARNVVHRALVKLRKKLGDRPPDFLQLNF